MKARDVLADAYDYWENHPRSCPGPPFPHLVAALLAVTPEGEGVYIAPDGTFMRAEWRAHEGPRGELAPPSRLTVEDIRTGNVANPNWATLYRLVPIEGDDRE